MRGDDVGNCLESAERQIHMSSTTVVQCERKHRRWWSKGKGKKDKKMSKGEDLRDVIESDFVASVEDIRAMPDFVVSLDECKSQSIPAGLGAGDALKSSMSDDLERRRTSVKRNSSNPCLTERECQALSSSYEFIDPSLIPEDEHYRV